MLGLSTRERLELQLLPVQHVRVHGRVGRAPRPNALARHLQQRLSTFIVQVSGAQGAHNLRGFGHRARCHVPRFPRTVVARRSTPSRRLTITTVSPGWWLRSASVMSYRLPMCLSPIAVITSPAARPACSESMGCGTGCCTKYEEPSVPSSSPLK